MAIFCMIGKRAPCIIRTPVLELSHSVTNLRTLKGLGWNLIVNKPKSMILSSVKKKGNKSHKIVRHTI